MSTLVGADGASTNATSTPAMAAHTANIGNLHNKIALVTGASSGIGRAITQAYAAAGAYIVNADLTPNPPSAPHLSATKGFENVDFTTPTVDLVNKQFPADSSNASRAAFIQCDVTDPSSVEAAVAFAVSTYGRLDIMVNNAGIAAEARSARDTRTHEQDVMYLEKDLAVNVKGMWLGCKYAIAQMLTQPSQHPSGDRGWVINMCSIAGSIALPGASPYCASKGAVLQITRTVAVEYAQDRIHVNCINPGFAETSFLENTRAREDGDKRMSAAASLHPWGRIALPEDVAKMAVFLAGEGASFCTGQAFVVDGGYTAQ